MPDYYSRLAATSGVGGSARLTLTRVRVNNTRNGVADEQSAGEVRATAAIFWEMTGHSVLINAV